MTQLLPDKSLQYSDNLNCFHFETLTGKQAELSGRLWHERFPLSLFEKSFGNQWG